jgi:DNA-binding NarL/FixJ family response regulator
MPEMSGLELLKILAGKDLKIPTIIITSNIDAAIRLHCFPASVVAYLPKPIHRAELFAAIDAASAGGSK